MKFNTMVKQGLVLTVLCCMSGLIQSMNSNVTIDHDDNGHVIGIRRPVQTVEPVAVADPDVLGVPAPVRYCGCPTIATPDEAQDYLGRHFARLINEQGLLEPGRYAQEKGQAIGALNLSEAVVDTVYHGVANEHIRRLHDEQQGLLLRNAQLNGDIAQLNDNVARVYQDNADMQAMVAAIQAARQSAADHVIQMQRELHDAQIARQLAEQHIQQVQQAQATVQRACKRKCCKKKRGVARKNVLKKRAVSKRKKHPVRKNKAHRKPCAVCRLKKNK